MTGERLNKSSYEGYGHLERITKTFILYEFYAKDTSFDEMLEILESKLRTDTRNSDDMIAKALDYGRELAKGLFDKYGGF